MVQFLIALWKLAQLVVFIVTSLPTVIKALKQLWDMARQLEGDKKATKLVAKNCVAEICTPLHLAQHVARNIQDDNGKPKTNRGPVSPGQA